MCCLQYYQPRKRTEKQHSHTHTHALSYADRLTTTLCRSDSCWCFIRTSRELNNRLHNKQVNLGQSVIFSSTAAASHSWRGAGSAGGSGSSSLSLSLSPPYDATRPSGPLTLALTFFSGAALLYRHTSLITSIADECSGC